MQLIIMHITVFSILIPIGVGLWRHSDLEKEARWLLYMLLPVAANQFLSVWWLYYVEKNNIPFYYIYILMELLFIARIYYSYLKKTKFRILVPVLAASFFVIWCLEFILYPENLWIFYSYLRTIEALIIVFYAALHFVEIYKKQEIMYLQKTAAFWIGGGFILYFLSNLLLFIFNELVFVLELGIFQSIWAVHAILLILLYTSFTIALLCKTTKVIS